MNILAKVATMSNDALANLCINAERLQRAGLPVQRAQAATLLPALKAELVVWQAAKRERAAAARREASARRANQQEAAASAG